MGKIKQGILGGFSGKVANVVGSSWKGIAVIKSLPLSVANPRTAGQMLQRNTMTQIVAVARILLPTLITSYWNRFAHQMSGFNKFVKANIAAFNATGVDQAALIKASLGSLVGIVPSNLTYDNVGHQLSFDWIDNTGTADALGDDTISVLVYNVTDNVFIFFPEAGLRSEASVDLATTLIAPGNTIAVYPFTARPDKSKVSDSYYYSDAV